MSLCLLPGVDELLGCGVGVVGTADGAHHEKAVDAGCLELRQVGFLDAAAHHDGTGLAAWSAARSSKLLVMMEPSAARPQSRLVSVS